MRARQPIRPVRTIEACHRRRSRPSAASGISQATYHGSSELEARSIASVAQAAPVQPAAPVARNHGQELLEKAGKPAP